MHITLDELLMVMLGQLFLLYKKIKSIFTSSHTIHFNWINNLWIKGNLTVFIFQG